MSYVVFLVIYVNILIVDLLAQQWTYPSNEGRLLILEKANEFVTLFVNEQ